MEINKYRDIKGVVTLEEIPEGRMVLITTSGAGHDFGSRTDLPAVRLPNDSTEAAKARYCLTHAVDNATPPLYQPYPAFSWALRQGFDQSSNVPFSATVHLTQPSVKEGVAVPSGALGLAFGPGEFSVPQAGWLTNAGIVPGAFLAVANTADDSEADAGKLKYSATATFLEVVGVDDDSNLTFRILY